jgi:hypothetical protein
VNKALIEKAAVQFLGYGNFIIEPLGNGLIHQTYTVYKPSDKKKIVLQAINTNVFKSPEDILNNYYNVYQYLKKNNAAISIPAPVFTINKQLSWIDEENNYWRANLFVDQSYSPDTATDEEAAYTVAKSFGSFTHALANLDIGELKTIIPDFHNLSLRYQQLEEAIEHARIERLLKATHVIAELRQRKQLLNWYESIKKNPAYPERVMHHDCKISNILFHTKTGKVICPVDLDTVMPGKFFSDIGDMIRSMSCTVDENNMQWEVIDIRPSFYKAIVNGYLEAIGNIFTVEEKNDIHYSGLVMIYMQAIRFLADFLQGDIYYKTNFPEQNLNRALNQLILLERLEGFLENEYQFIDEP